MKLKLTPYDRVLAQAIIAGFVVSSGCSKRSPQARATPLRSDPWATDKTSIRAKPKSWQVTIDDSGQQPEAVLRYAPGTIDREIHYVLVVADHTNATIVDMRYRWTCLPCRYHLTRLAPADAPDPIKRQFASMAKDVHGDVTISTDGHVAVQPATIVSTTPSTSELFATAVVPFPTVPVGVGARWTVTDGSKKTQVTLLSRDDHGASVAIDVVDTAGGERVEAHGKLAVSFTDPVAKGVLDMTQTLSIREGSGALANIGHLRATLD